MGGYLVGGELAKIALLFQTVQDYLRAELVFEPNYLGWYVCDLNPRFL